MINRLCFAGVLLPNISKTIRRTVFCSVAATVVGIAIGALAIFRLENIVARLLLGSGVIAFVVTGVMLVLLPDLRVELSRLLAAVKTGIGTVTELDRAGASPPS
jgi:hypothetical protein